MVAQKNGVSAQNLCRVLPIGSYQTAWAMLAKLRTAMAATEKTKLSGTVEVDEWFHGGVAKGGNAFTGKNLVIAAVEHASHGGGFGRVRFGIIESRSRAELRKFIRATIEPRSLVITDGLRAYEQALAGYRHEPRNESAPGAPEGHMLLPGVHRVFSLAERWLLGTHQGGVSRQHLQGYLDEFAFRWNRRKSENPGLPFMRLLQHAVNAPPVTYRELVKTEANPERRSGPAPISRRTPGTLESSSSKRPWRMHSANVEM